MSLNSIVMVPVGSSPIPRLSGPAANAAGQNATTSATAWANACGASWGRLCPMPLLI